MNAALLQLMAWRLRGGARYRLRQLSTRRGLIAMTVLLAAVWLIASAKWNAAPNAVATTADSMRANITIFMPVGLLAATAFTVLVSGATPLRFPPQEVNFLCAGPFTRRSVLAYKFSNYCLGAMINALIIALLLPSHTASGLSVFATVFLSMLFVQLASMTSSLAVSVCRQSWPKLLRNSSICVAIILSVILFWDLRDAWSSGMQELFYSARHHWLIEFMLAPFAAFAQILLANKNWPQLALWSAVGIGLNATLLVAIVALDSIAAESISTSEVRAQRPRMRSNRNRILPFNLSVRVRSIVRMPRFGGLGPIVYRQLISAYRNNMRAIVGWMVVAIAGGAVLSNMFGRANATGLLAIVYLFATYALPKSILLDFRSELDRLELYKSLPISGFRICAAQTVVAALVTSAIEFMFLGVLWFAGVENLRWMIEVAMLLLLPINLVLYALENLMFLLVPSRPVPVGRVDFEFMGRTVAEYIGKSIILVAIVAAAIAVGVNVLHVTNHTLSLAVGASIAVLLGCLVVFLALCALAYRNFEVTETVE